jgi:hypothetical protein
VGQIKPLYARHNLYINLLDMTFDTHQITCSLYVWKFTHYCACVGVILQCDTRVHGSRPCRPHIVICDGSDVDWQCCLYQNVHSNILLSSTLWAILLNLFHFRTLKGKYICNRLYSYIHRPLRRRDFNVFCTANLQMAVRLAALRSGRPLKSLKTKLRGLSPPNYTNRATSLCRRS